MNLSQRMEMIEFLNIINENHELSKELGLVEDTSENEVECNYKKIKIIKEDNL